jgi:hypothetical protein
MENIPTKLIHTQYVIDFAILHTTIHPVVILCCHIRRSGHRYFYLTDRSVFFRGIPLDVVDPQEVYEWEKACYNVFESEFEIEAVQLVPGKGCGYVRVSDVAYILINVPKIIVYVCVLQLTSSENVNNAIEELDGVQLVYNEKGYELLLSTVEWR